MIMAREDGDQLRSRPGKNHPWRKFRSGEPRTEPRNKKAEMSLTFSERKDLEAKARAAGKTISQYMRDLVLNPSPPPAADYSQDA
jgi:hypothetical protein